VNEDELAEFLESGRRPGALGDPARSGADPANVRDLLGDDGVWAEPAPGGLDALLAAIEAEGGGADRPVAPIAPVAEPTPGPVEAVPGPAEAAPGAGRPLHARRRSPSRARRLAVVLAAAAAVVLVAGVVAVMVRSDDGGGREVEVAGTELAPDASGTATVENTPSGVRIHLDVRGLPPAAPGTYYQAWVKGPNGLVTVGTFHVREGDDTVELWSGVELDEYPTLTVTIQQEGQGQESSGRVVLSGRIAP
jgi:Anti-sigma-K factor rskA